MSTKVSVASVRLPAIRHPLSSLGDPETISLRGYSTDPNQRRLNPVGRPRPLSPGKESLDSAFLSWTTKSSRSLCSEKTPWLESGSFVLPAQIPEGVAVTEAQDTNQPRLPVFGRKVAPESRTSSRAGVVTSSSILTRASPEAKLRIQVDQLECELRVKLQTSGPLALKTLFKNNNPDGKPLVSRDVLHMVLSKFLGRLITSTQLRHLLLRLHLAEKALLGHRELWEALEAQPALGGGARWMDPTLGPHKGGPLRASQALALVRGPARSRFLECLEAITMKETQRPAWVLAPELKNVLEQLAIHLEEQEFEHLWKRLDVDGIGAVKHNVLLKKLGLVKKRKPNISESIKREATSVKVEEPKAPVRVLSKAEQERRASITMETWLKDRFREGFRQMRAEFERQDPERSGKVGVEEFLQVLQGAGLHLRREHLGAFLSRCGLQLHKSSVDYPAFLCRFQDRSQHGITSQILSNPQHRFHKGLVSQASSVSAVEAKLTQLFQSEYLSLLQALRGIDQFNQKTVSPEEFRAAVESRFGVEISDAEFEQLLDRLPLDGHGNVQYPLFMATFDTRKGVPSLFQPNSMSGSEERRSIRGAGEDRGTLGQTRDARQLCSALRRLVKLQYPALQRAFEEQDERNTRRLTQEDMFQLLRRFDLRPEVTRGDVRRLWASLITNADGTLDFLQFARHFGPSPRSGCYPNAKRSPPKRGDDDLMPRSKKLNAVSDIIVDNLRAKVELCVESLRAEFAGMDPYATGFVSQEEFKEVLLGLCVRLSPYECDLLIRKFDTNNDGRVCYTEFLRPFASYKQQWKYGSNMAEVLQSHRESGEFHKGKETSVLEGLSAKLKRKLRRRRRALRQACVRLDRSGCGLLSVAELSAVLQLCGVRMELGELHYLLSLLEPDPTGRLHYQPLLLENPTDRE